MNRNQEAFPIPADGSPGMSLRDWFAGQALAGRLAASSSYEAPELTTAVCYGLADAMLKLCQNKG